MTKDAYVSCTMFDCTIDMTCTSSLHNLYASYEFIKLHENKLLFATVIESDHRFVLCKHLPVAWGKKKSKTENFVASCVSDT